MSSAASRCSGCDLRDGDHTSWCRIAHPHTDMGSLYRLSCGCRARLAYGVLTALAWKVEHRCKRHPNGPVPVRSMRAYMTAARRRGGA